MGEGCIGGVGPHSLLRKIFIEEDDDVVFENQRFKPGKGWGNQVHGLGGNLLPTDRGAFSDRDGLIWCTHDHKVVSPLPSYTSPCVLLTPQGRDPHCTILTVLY
jgi:hypothetical protein